MFRKITMILMAFMYIATITSGTNVALAPYFERPMIAIDDMAYTAPNPNEDEVDEYGFGKTVTLSNITPTDTANHYVPAVYAAEVGSILPSVEPVQIPYIIEDPVDDLMEIIAEEPVIEEPSVPEEETPENAEVEEEAVVDEPITEPEEIVEEMECVDCCSDAVIEEEIAAEEAAKAPTQREQVNMTDSEYKEFVKLVFCESGGESVETQRWVAQSIINRVLSDEYPDNVHDVIWQKKQYSPTFDGSWKNAYKSDSSNWNYDVCDEILNRTEPYCSAMHFCMEGYSRWHDRNLTYIKTMDGTKFYK